MKQLKVNREKMVMVSLRMPRKLAEALREQAKNSGLGYNEYIRRKLAAGIMRKAGGI